MPNARGVENRKNPRFPIRLSAEVNHTGRLFTAVTRDLSLGGVCLEAGRVLPEGDAIHLALFLVVDDVEDATQPPLEVRARVVWAAAGEEGRPSTIGLRFEALSSIQTAGLQRLLRIFPA